MLLSTEVASHARPTESEKANVDEIEKLKIEKDYWQAKCHHLSDELNRRSLALSQHLQNEAALRHESKRLEHLQAEIQRQMSEVEQQQRQALTKNAHLITKLKEQLKKQQKQLDYLYRVKKSAEAWQTRSWFKRAFHRWKTPGRA